LLCQPFRFEHGVVSQVRHPGVEPTEQVADERSDFRIQRACGGIIYAETLSVTWAATNLAKISFRRPRPYAYQEQARREASGSTLAPEGLSETNNAMSFFSGHASIAASVTAASTYLAFSRSADRLRPWLTLGIGTALTTMVAVGRVEAAEHFPTDVIAGAMAGAGIGVLVPHLHREEPALRRPVWIGLGVEPDGASIRVQGLL
jgi:undecaprenyl-diphosphatase